MRVVGGSEYGGDVGRIRLMVYRTLYNIAYFRFFPSLLFFFGCFSYSRSLIPIVVLFYLFFLLCLVVCGGLGCCTICALRVSFYN